MLRQVLRELRYHPSRFIATMIAIAISVAFMAGSSILVATENNSVQREQSARYGNADVIVSITTDNRQNVEDAGKLIAGTPGVAASAPSLTSTLALKHGQTSLYADLIGLPTDESLRNVRVAEGRTPAAAGELLLGRGAARTLGVGIGDTVASSYDDDTTYTVVGLTDQPGSLFLQSVYVAPAEFTRQGVDATVGNGNWLVKAASGVSADTLATDVKASLGQFDDVRVQTAAEARSQAMEDFTGSFDVFRNLLWAFAAIAAVVGMITIANTFTILLAQRRRQIGLLRAVGAAGAQVRRRFLLEAIALGVIGSGLGLLLGAGLAVIGASLSGSLYWGLALPGVDLAVAFGVGVLITVLAAWLPVVRGTRVRPLEALQPEPPAEAKRRAGVVRGVICGLLVAVGLFLSLSRLGTDGALLMAIAGSALVAVGVLFAAPLFVPLLLRGAGALVGRFGATARLASDNAVRNPRRASTTATALMLAVGLIVTLQVATASIRGSILDEIDQHRPVDIAVTSGELSTIPAEVVEKLGRINGVAGSVALPATTAEVTINGDSYGELKVVGYEPDAASVARRAPASVPDGKVYVPQYTGIKAGQQATVKSRATSLTLEIVPSPLADDTQVLVSPATLTKLGGAVPSAVVWLSVPNRGDAVSVAAAVTEVIGTDAYQLSGGVIEGAAMESVLNLLLGITTALLGVAVLIALIGVSNTLGLSVLERTRESALMRALGLQARSLRLMLLIEALLLALVGTVVGIAAGMWFGWLGAQSVASAMDSTVQLAVNPPQTLGMVLIAVLAAALASVLPGRRAAKASPTEALAEI